jgi:lipoic acid synthetase
MLRRCAAAQTLIVGGAPVRHLSQHNATGGIPSAESADAASAAPLTGKQKDFLEGFRGRLAAADAKDADATNLQDFVTAAAIDEHVKKTGGSADTLLREPAITMGASIPAAAVKRGVDRLPSWVKLEIPKGPSRRPKYNKIRAAMRAKGLSTVCEEAKCPNIGECWGGGDTEDGAATATIMMMGDTCTRGCRFCSIKTARIPPPLDPEEPDKVAAAVGDMGVEYIVVTMVDRDDLEDGGAQHVATTLNNIKTRTNVMVEVLAGDFRGRKDMVELVAKSGVDCYAHNIECVERVSPRVRDRRADYRQSLAMLEHARIVCPTVTTKSSIMLGVGEEVHEVRQTLRDLRTAGVTAVTLGQYLQPATTRMKVSRYAHPDEFDMWKDEALAMGFGFCASGPLVRSSYRAGEYFLANHVKLTKANADSAAAIAAGNAAAASTTQQ